MPEPALPEYLDKPYAAKPGQRGGTLIAEDVWDRSVHQERVLSPDGYRPAACPSCLGFLCGHGVRYRRLKDEPGWVEEMLRRYRCCGCLGVWQVLPGYLARHLHRTWGAVQSRLVAAGELERTGSEWRVRSIPTTLRRWTLRLAAAATVVCQVLVDGDAATAEALTDLGVWSTRRELVEGLAVAGLVARERKLGALAGWVHRMAPGVRVM